MTDAASLESIKRLLDLSHLVGAAGLTQQAGSEPLRFGDVAVKLRLVKRKQVNAALALQRLDDEAGRPHRRLGEILVELGTLTPAGVERVLERLTSKTYAEQRRRRRRRRLDADGPLVTPLA